MPFHKPNIHNFYCAYPMCYLQMPIVYSANIAFIFKDVASAIVL